MHQFFDRSIEFLKGVGPHRAETLNKELQIFTFADLLQHYPFRHEDRSKFYKVKELQPDLPYVQLIGEFKSFKTIGIGRRARLVGVFADETGSIEMVWFKGIQWVQKSLTIGVKYVAFGKATLYNGKFNIAHPEVEVLTEKNAKGGYLIPVYHTSEKMKKKGMDSKFITKAMKVLLVEAVNHIPETLPHHLLQKFKLIDKKTAVVAMHFPRNAQQLIIAQNRMKFEELFFVQLRLIKLKIARTEKYKGAIINTSDLLNQFYEKHIPFELTGAQKRVVKEIYADFRSGQQMNRLVQGDVGSGKTMVAFLSILIAIGSGFQCAFMAPTEILAEQHFKGLQEWTKPLGIQMARLTGSTPTSERKLIHEGLMSGVITILVGTHALLEDKVKFKNLGLAVIDEQHRFGVAQRAKLWTKTKDTYPHVLVMTATPIPRTLAMTLYGDLDVSVIDELPAGRKPIKTKHFFETKRLEMFGFVEKEIKKGRQAYIVYPLIEESATLDYKDLMDGYEGITRRFPNYQISIVHGKMKAEDKEWEMQRFVKGETQIMVATTVIEVGVNVPNASIMVIENAERFGLSQLHQLRGRVGRGAEQSYCILMSGVKLSTDGRKRLRTMVDTTDGFKIAEVDLELRGPGDLMGTRQSGVLDLLVSDLVKDGEILKTARIAAQDILKTDPKLQKPEHQMIKSHIDSFSKNTVNWGRIS
ncbi:ATP-dependent DNA helicase RecG [Ekhidna lutea]|uniref:ATP-dependent DNA helicase RecG n=1 Tax=Ekhidna lutea TaxID=447679 RepID=A0A239ESS4_EKHLU|nr:ATP-dependent DNA helicase RecG [Ekhidna lutea]SNS46942.1 ATP-dependent DNA helicase RecG [Ekhidna lutea]